MTQASCLNGEKNSRPCGGAFVRITAPHFCAAFIEGHIYAPILRYMRGWSLERVRSYCARKGWKFEVIE